MTSPSAQDALKLALREQVGTALRSHGYKGSPPTWTLTNAKGDRAIVNAQSSSSSTKGHVLFVVNISIIPLVWWRWRNHRDGLSNSRAPKEYDGLWRQRLHARRQQASSRPDWWSITDTASAGRAAADVVDQLEHEVVDDIQRLLQPGAMLDAARSGRLGMATYDTRGAVAVLLTEEGPSLELATLLDELETLEDNRLRSTFWPYVQWCRETIRSS